MRSILILLALCGVAHAQLGVGINHNTTLQGTGSTASPLGVNMTLLAGNGLTSTATTFDVGAGTGITVGADSISVNTAVIQAKVTGTCATPSAITGINTDGTVSCSSSAIDGSGTNGRSARWTPDGNSLGTGAFTDDGTNATALGTLASLGNFTAGDTTADAHTVNGRIQFVGDASSRFMYLSDTGTNFGVIYDSGGKIRIGGAATVGGAPAIASFEIDPNASAVTALGTLGVVGTARIHSGLSGADIADSLQVGNLIASTTSDDIGWSVGMNRSGGNVTNDTKLGAGGSLLYRIGAGTNNGFTNSWLSVDGSGNATFPKNAAITGTLAVTGTFDSDASLAKFGTTDGAGYFYEGILNAGYASNTTADLAFNFVGYQAGTTQFRNAAFYDGKNALACTLTGSSKSLNCVGGLQENGTAVLSGAITNDTIPKGSGGNLTDSPITSNSADSFISPQGTSTAGIFLGANDSSYFMFGANQDLFIRGGKAASVIWIGDSTNTGGVVLGSATNNTQVTGALSVLANTTLGNDATADTTTINGATTINTSTGKIVTIVGSTNGLNDGALQIKSNKTGWGNITSQLVTNAGGSTTADGLTVSIDSGYIALRPGAGSNALAVLHGGDIAAGDTGATAIANNLDVLTLGNTGVDMTSDIALIRAIAPSWSFDLSSFATRNAYGGDFESSAHGPAADCGGSPCYPSAGQMFNHGIRARALGTDSADNIGGLFEAANGSTNVAIKTTTGDVWLNNTDGVTNIGSAGGTGDRLTVFGNTYVTHDTTLGTSTSDTLAIASKITSHYVTASGAPAASSCGTSPAVTGSDTDFKVVTGTGATGCVLTFASAFTTNAPVCGVTPADNNDAFSYTISTSALTISSAPASATYYVHCGGWL